MEPRCYNHQNGGHDERYALSSDDELFEDVAEETKPRGFYAMIYRSFLFSLIVFATRSEVRLTAYTGMILFFPLSHALPIYIIRSARQGDFPRMHTSGN